MITKNKVDKKQYELEFKKRYNILGRSLMYDSCKNIFGSFLINLTNAGLMTCTSVSCVWDDLIFI